MAMFATGDANSVLNAVLQVSSYPSVSSAKIRLGSTIGSAGSAMTELPNGGGYSTGGLAITFASASGQSSSNSGSLNWNNTSGIAWNIEGLEIWDTAGTPIRHLFGSWTGQPINVASGNSFTVPASGVTCSLV